MGDLKNRKMEAATLASGLSKISGLGVGLNQTQQSALDTSVIIAQANHKFTAVRFWGKISGIKEDYFIVYGINKDELSGRKFLYSLNCIDWHLLQDPSEDSLTKSEVIRGRFIGDPSYEYEHVNVERLGAVVYNITNEFVVPRRAFMKSSEGLVSKNPSYNGLNDEETAHMSNWFHFKSKHTKVQTVKQLAHVDPAIDFMDTIEDDIPVGIWSIQNDRGVNVTLRNLKWIGLIAYAVPNCTRYGCAYFGTGEPNYDLPFML